MSASKESSQHERKGKKSHEQKSHKKSEKNEARTAAVAVGVDGWVPGGQSTTRKEFSGKKITFPCLMIGRQVDDVPPKAEAVTVDAKLNV